MPDLDPSSAAIGELRGLVAGVHRDLAVGAEGRRVMHSRMNEVVAQCGELAKSQALIAQSLETLARDSAKSYEALTADVAPLKAEVEGYRGLRNRAVGALTVIGCTAGAVGAALWAVLPPIITKYFSAPQ